LMMVPLLALTLPGLMMVPLLALTLPVVESSAGLGVVELGAGGQVVGGHGPRDLRQTVATRFGGW